MSEESAVLSHKMQKNLTTVFDIKIDRFCYGRLAALRHVHLEIPKNRITAFIGPSGCGKSTTLRCLNRMHSQNRTKLEGQILFDNQNLYHPSIDPRMVRVHIGMVFQQPNPFRLSVFDNVAFGLRLNGIRDNIPGRVENALRQAALWDDVKDRLKESGTSLSGGQQQRLCIARAIAVEPQVLLMDEPCSALDPISTSKIEELILELKRRFSIVIVTHNLGQATRISDNLAYFFVERDKDSRFGRLHEYGPTQELVDNPKSESLRSYSYRQNRLNFPRPQSTGQKRHEINFPAEARKPSLLAGRVQDRQSGKVFKQSNQTRSLIQSAGLVSEAGKNFSANVRTNLQFQRKSDCVRPATEGEENKTRPCVDKLRKGGGGAASIIDCRYRYQI